MIVSKDQDRDQPREAHGALGWLGRELAWERVLHRLRVEAGILPPDAALAPDASEDRPAA